MTYPSEIFKMIGALESMKNGKCIVCGGGVGKAIHEPRCSVARALWEANQIASEMTAGYAAKPEEPETCLNR